MTARETTARQMATATVPNIPGENIAGEIIGGKTIVAEPTVGEREVIELGMRLIRSNSQEDETNQKSTEVDRRSGHNRTTSNRGSISCYICRENTATVTTQCGCEYYDAACIKEWLEQSKHCPRCNKPMTPNDVAPFGDEFDALADSGDSDYTYDSEGYQISVYGR